MGIRLSKCILLLAILWMVYPTRAQFSFLSEPYNELDIKFIREKIEASPEKSFFNLVAIKNNSSQPLSFQVNFSIPQGWNLFANQSQNLTLNSNDSLILPVRASISKDVKGEIGYVMVASIADKKGKVVKASYSYVNIPKNADLSYRPVKRYDYFDQNSRKASLSFSFKNDGNVDEQIFLSLKLDNDLQMDGDNNGYYYDDIFLPARKDTVVETVIYLSENSNVDKLMYRVALEASTKDTVFRSTFWLKDLRPSFNNIINPESKMLVVDLLAANLFSDQGSTYSLTFFGRTLFKNQTDLFYRYQNFSMANRDELFKESQMNLGYRIKNSEIIIGDIANSIENSMSGRGLEANLRYKRSDLLTIISKDKYIDALKYGNLANIQVLENLKITAGYSINDNIEYNKKSEIYIAGLSFRAFNNIDLSFIPSYSTSRNENNPVLTSFAYKFGLGYRIGNFTHSTTARLSDKNYAGIMGGRSDINSTFAYPLDKFLSFSGRYNLYSYSTQTLYSDTLYREVNSKVDVGEIRFNHVISPVVSYYIGPYYESQSSNSLTRMPENEYFSVYSAKINAGFKITNSNKTILFSPSIRAGLSYIGNYSDSLIGISAEFKKPTPAPAGMFGINMKVKNLSIYTGYFFGPMSVSQAYNQFYYGIEPKSLRFMPSYEQFVYSDIIKVSARANWVNTIESKTNRVNFAGEITSYLKYGFTLKFLTSYSRQSVNDLATEKRETFSSVYFEFGLRKEFDINQPRLKFHDLFVVFFKDYNGNNVQDLNEPGVKDVLLELARDEQADLENQNYIYSGEYVSNELLSDQLGRTSYYNIPEGKYFMKFTPLGKMEGNFSYAIGEQQIVVEKNKTIFIPFFENNKIFGSIIMNRSKLSNLGKLDLSNIKITATDAKGLEISTLTDAQGKFVLYVPTVDKYTVRINNIFYENFDLQQNDFEVQLNGYKQFEVTFIFNEKSRRINFSSSLDYEQTLGQQDVRIMRRTTMQGTVKDAATLKPLKAKISIIDNSTGQAIASTNAGLRTGEFNMSFLAGDNYVLMVTADEYWFYSENLYLNQLTTFQNFNREVLLKSIDIGSSIELNNVTFERNKATLAPEAMAELENLAKVLKNNPNVIVEIGGHCDDIEAAQNASIADDRAKAVAAFLIDREIPNITSKSYSNSRPVATGETEESHKKNRRVEVTVIDK